MKKTVIILLSALAAFLTGCTAVSVEPEPQTEPDSDALEACYDQGVALVRFSEEMTELIEADLAAGSVMTKSSELNSFVRQYGITSIERVFSDDPRWTERHHRAGLDRWYTVTFDKDAITATRAADRLSAIPGVEIAEPSPKVEATDNYYDDLYFGSQWHLRGTYNINVEPVWENYTKGDPDVIVAVVDTGIDPTHEDLIDNLIPGGEGGSWNFFDDTATITSENHGTHVAGIIAAVPNNGIGVAGIAGGDAAEGISGTRLLNCQSFSGSSSCNAAGFANALTYGADNGALISQNSWSYNYSTETNASKGSTPEAVRTAIDYFAQYAGCDNDGNQLPDSKMKGGIVVFAAGNNGWRYGQPASYETVIAVGATDSLGTRATYSNYGDWVDICAPGTAVMSCYNGSSYGTLNGTSMACPMVSGVAALVIAARGGYGFTADMLRECLIEGADPDKVSAANVGPYLDAYGAVTYQFPIEYVPSPVDTTYSAAASGLDIDFTWSVPYGTVSGISPGNEPVSGTLLFASRDRSAIEGIDPEDYVAGVSSSRQTLSSEDNGVFFTEVPTADMEVGDEATGTVTVDTYGATYYVTCISFDDTDEGRLYAEASAIKSVTTGDNHPPVITPSQDVTDLSLLVSETLTVDFTVEDPENHDYTIEFGNSSAAEQWTQTAAGKYTLTLDGDAKDSDGNWVEPGSYSTTITATDSYGASSTCGVRYTIIEPESAPSAVDSYTAVASDLDVNFTWKVPSGNYYGNLPPDGTLLFASSSRDAIENLNPADFDASAATSGTNELGNPVIFLSTLSGDIFFTDIATSALAVGDTATGTAVVDSYGTTFYVTLVAYNDFEAGRLYADAAEIKTVTTAENNPPFITPSQDVTDLSLLVSETLTVDFTVEDLENHDFTIEFGNASAAELWTQTAVGKYSLTLDGDAKDYAGNWVEPGSYTTNITATDSYGASSTCGIHYTIIEPDSAPLKVDSYTAEADALDINFFWTVPSGNYYETLPPDGALLFAGATRESIENLDPQNPAGDIFRLDVSTSEKTVGSQATGTVPVDSYATTYYVTIVNYNEFEAGRLYADAAEIKSVTTVANNPPAITPSQTVDNITLTVSETKSLTLTVSDPEGHDFTTKYTTASIAETWTKISEGEYTLTLTGGAKTSAGKYVDTGSYVTTLSATDSYDGTSVCEIRYTILENEAPTVTKSMDNALLFLGSSSTDNVQFDLDSYFSDPEGEALSYAVENTSSATASVSISSSNRLTVKGVQSGTATITVTASDPRGLTCSQSFIVVVRGEGQYVIVYPNPVIDILHIGTDALSDTATSIKVANSSGFTVYNVSTSASAFSPADIDFTSYAPGTYSVRIVYGSTDVTFKVVREGSGL
ncbi:MAG: S8 family serine peptidase [Bacteroidales bacterium]|nr:S8 family serine peptidase [Bacteroidales bacterium]